MGEWVTLTGDARVDEGLGRLRAESDAFIAELAALAPEDWDRPTNCPPWTVRMLAAHVTRGADSYLVALERGKQGDLTVAFSREQRDREMREIAAREPATILTDLRAATDRFERELGGLRGEQLDTLGAHRHGPRTARWFVEQRLAEVAFHRWDLHRSLGRSFDLDQDTAVFLLTMLLEQNAPALNRLYAATGRGSFRLAVRDGGPAWRAVAEPGSLVVARDNGEPVEATLEGDAAALALVVYGRRPLTELEREARIAVSGDRAIAERFSEVFRNP